MAKTAQTPQQTRRICGLRGCKAVLRHPGTGMGCEGPECTNYYKKWSGWRGLVQPAGKLPVAVPPYPVEEVDDRAAMLAAIAARKKKAGRK